MKPKLLLAMALLLAAPAPAEPASPESCSSCVVSGGGGAGFCDPHAFKEKESTFDLIVGARNSEESDAAVDSCPSETVGKLDFKMQNSEGDSNLAVSTLGWMMDLQRKTCPLNKAFDKLKFKLKGASVKSLMKSLKDPGVKFEVRIVGFRKDACCDKRERQLNGFRVTPEIEVSIRLTVFSVGVPYVGDVRVRVTPSIALSETFELNGECKPQDCKPAGKLTGELEVELIAEVLAGLAKASGSGSGSVTAKAKVCSKEPQFSVGAQVDQIKATIKASAAWGLVSYSQDYDVMKSALPIKFLQYP